MSVEFVTYRSCLEGLYLAAFRMPPTLAEIYEKRRRIIQTLVWFGSALIIAVYVKDIQYAIALIGGLAALFIFFYPGKQTLISCNDLVTMVSYNILMTKFAGHGQSGNLCSTVLLQCQDMKLIFFFWEPLSSWIFQTGGQFKSCCSPFL